jgi:hypothetical protein
LFIQFKMCMFFSQTDVYYLVASLCLGWFWNSGIQTIRKADLKSSFNVAVHQSLFGPVRVSRKRVGVASDRNVVGSNHRKQKLDLVTGQILNRYLRKQISKVKIKIWKQKSNPFSDAIGSGGSFVCFLPNDSIEFIIS